MHRLHRDTSDNFIVPDKVQKIVLQDDSRYVHRDTQDDLDVPLGL
jgi:hypothetical protein